jgi:hypothetical protein
MTEISSAQLSGRIAARWARLSTGLKMLLILSLGLLPLGIIAVLASIDNARANRSKADLEARAMVSLHAQRLSIALTRNSFTIRAARDAIIEAGDPAGICRRTLDRLGRQPNTPGRFALFGQAPAPRCLSDGFAPPPPPRATAGEVARPLIAPGGDRLEIFMYDPTGAIEGIAEYQRQALASVVDTPHGEGNFAIELVQGDRVMPLRGADTGGALTREVVADYPFASNQFVMRLRT